MPSLRGRSKKIEEYLPASLQMTPEEKASVCKDLEAVRDGLLSRLPLVCKGPDCRYAKTCPLEKLGRSPLNSSCPIEALLIDEWVNQHMKTLAIDPENSIELDMLYDLVEMELFDMRTSQDIALGDLFDEQAIGFDNKGRPILRKEKAVALEVKMDIKNMKSKLRHQFLATPEIRAKYKVGQITDPASMAADLLEEYKESIEARKKEILGPTPETIDIEVETEEEHGQEE